MNAWTNTFKSLPEWFRGGEDDARPRYFVWQMKQQQHNPLEQTKWAALNMPFLPSDPYLSPLTSQLVTSWLWTPFCAYYLKPLAFISAVLPNGLFPGIPWPVASGCSVLAGFICGVLLLFPPMWGFVATIPARVSQLGREQSCCRQRALAHRSVWKWGKNCFTWSNPLSFALSSGLIIALHWCCSH